jgi:hypothetical protein
VRVPLPASHAGNWNHARGEISMKPALTAIQTAKRTAHAQPSR